MADRRVGFIGLGGMGKGMARNIVKGGFDTIVYDVRIDPLKELEKVGAKVAMSPKEVGAKSNIVITMVRDDFQTKQVIFEKEGVIEGIKPGSTILIMGTVSPLCAQSIAKRAKATKEVNVLDAAVSGGTVGAEAGTLSIMVGGDEQVLERCRDVLEKMSKEIFHCGTVGAGLVVKLVNNMINISTVALVSEAITLGQKEGVNLDLLLNIFNTSTARSWVTQNWDWFTKARRNPAFVEILYKDLTLALNLAKEKQVATPIVSLCSKYDFHIRE
jgi:2-hydroxymethylglutarate dehydrogenase